MSEEKLRSNSNSSSSPPSSQSTFDVRDVFRFINRHKFTYAALVFVSISLMALHHFYFPYYRARSIIYVSPGDRQIDRITNRLQGDFYDSVRSNDVEKYMRYLNSDSFFKSMAEKVGSKGLPKEYEIETKKNYGLLGILRSVKNKIFERGASSPQKDLSEFLEQWVSFDLVGSDGIAIQVTTTQRQLSKDFADIASDVALDWISKNEIKGMSNAIGYIQDRINGSEKNIHDLEIKMLKFKQEHGIVALDNSGFVTKITELEREIEIGQVEYNQNQRILNKYKKKLNKQVREIEDLNRVASETGGREIKFKTDLSQKIAEVEARNQALEARIASLQHQISGSYDSGSLNAEHDIFDFRKRLEIEYALFEELKREMFRVEVQRVSLASKVKNLQRADNASVYRKVGLARKTLLTLAMALVFGTIIAYLVDMLWPAVRGRLDLEKLGFQFAGNIPDVGDLIKTRYGALFSRVGGKFTNIFRFDSDAAPVNHFLRLRTKILYQLEGMNKDRGIISFMSAGSEEGKTFLASNFAVAAGRYGKKVLFIDADMRVAGASKEFQLSHLGGFAEVLDAPELFPGLVKKNLFMNMDFLPAGRKVCNPTESMSRPSFAALLDSLRSVYDLIVIDTAPILVVPEHTLLEKTSDLVVLVTRYNHTHIESIIKATESFLEFGVTQGKYLATINRVNLSNEFAMFISGDYYGAKKYNRDFKVG